MEFISPNEEEAFNIEIINKKKSLTPAPIKNKKKLWESAYIYKFVIYL